MRQVAQLTGVPEPLVLSFLYEGPLSQQYELGRISTDDFCHRFAETFAVTVNHEALAHAASDMFRPNQPMIDLMEHARALKLTTVLLSNTNEEHFQHLWSRHDFLHHFDHLVLSCRVGLMKPDPQIYALAVRAAGCRADETLFTDDLTENVAGAKACGMHADLYTDYAAYQAALRKYGIPA